MNREDESHGVNDVVVVAAAAEVAVVVVAATDAAVIVVAAADAKAHVAEWVGYSVSSVVEQAFDYMESGVARVVGVHTVVGQTVADGEILG